MLRAPDGTYSSKVGILDFGQVCRRCPEVDAVFVDWCRRAPIDGVPSEHDAMVWLQLLDIQPKKGKALESASTLFAPTEQGGPMFPDLEKELSERFVGHILLLQYLAQWELNAGMARKKLGLPDGPDGKRVLKTFKEIAEQIWGEKD